MLRVQSELQSESVSFPLPAGRSPNVELLLLYSPRKSTSANDINITAQQVIILILPIKKYHDVHNVMIYLSTGTQRYCNKRPSEVVKT